jgi:L-aminopeptidase/D-esterase-like protein
LYRSPEHLDHIEFVPWGHLDPFYEAVVQAVEEAVANAPVANEDMTGRNSSLRGTDSIADNGVRVWAAILLIVIGG